MAKRLLICIGTKKGLFVAESNRSRRKFELRGPFGPGVAVYSGLIDNRRSPRIYASSCHPFFGMKILVSTDLGKKFQPTKSAPAFPEGDGRALANIWSLETGEAKKVLWCGVEPAARLTRVVQAPEIAEPRIIRQSVDPEQPVGLGIEHVGVGA